MLLNRYICTKCGRTLERLEPENAEEREEVIKECCEGKSHQMLVRSVSVEKENK